ncbi:hypothetical protein V6N13_020695 [Hibiscus sabdariffa]|uniref:Uncharacterized protein n=1 Tax=Hibiscus sabdariffa TaxID=183260 RepID=A0ABR2EX44_9ROSI
MLASTFLMMNFSLIKFRRVKAWNLLYKCRYQELESKPTLQGNILPHHMRWLRIGTVPKCCREVGERYRTSTRCTIVAKELFSNSDMTSKCRPIGKLADTTTNARQAATARETNVKPGTEARLLFLADCRQLMDPHLPKGFYANCFFQITIAAPSNLLKQASSIDVIKLIQEAIAQWVP